MSRTTTDSAVGMEASLEAGMHNENTAVERLEELARAAIADNDNPDMWASVESLDAFNRAMSPEAAISLIESLRHSVEREAGLREAATAVLALPDAVAALGYLDRGIGTRTPTAAWLRLRAALDRRAGT